MLDRLLALKIPCFPVILVACLQLLTLWFFLAKTEDLVHQAMKAASSGLYCGPLRLLAMEVYDSINQQV